MSEKWDTLTKKELIQLLEPYDDKKIIVFKVKLQQGNVGFYDLKKDDKRSDSDKLVLTSETLDKWYDEDIKELLEKIKTLKSELSFSQNQNRELRKVLKDNRSMAEVVEENKELKRFKDKVFNLIDKKIKEAEKYYYDESVIIELNEILKGLSE